MDGIFRQLPTGRRRSASFFCRNSKPSWEVVRRLREPGSLRLSPGEAGVMVELSPLRQLRMGQLPKMVSWYDPRLLARIGVRTIISSVFGQYADQRLIQAVTDPCDDKDLATRYDYCDPNVHDRCIAADENGAYWIDYVADVGDGFESTYTIAY